MTTVANEAWFRDEKLARIFALLNAQGTEVRVVGGAVRNSLLGLAVHDVDMATTAMPHDVMQRAQAAGIKAVPTGIAHGTVTLVIDGQPFEVTTLRRDVETDGRHAEVAFSTDWEEDAGRRDFTINALYATQDGEVIDHVGGLGDLDPPVVRFIGDAATRISEDYLRILRFFRFFAHYGSGRPDAQALRACARAKDKLSTLSAERVWSELKKLLSAADPGRALLWMRQAGVLTQILPETEKWGIDLIPGLVETGAALGWDNDPMLRLAAILPDDRDRLKALAARLRLSGNEAKILEDWAASPAVPEKIAAIAFDRLLYEFGASGLIFRLKLALSHVRPAASHDAAAMEKAALLAKLLSRAEKWEKPVFPVSGKDLIDKGFQPGPEMGETLARLERHWVSMNFILDKEQLLSGL